MADRAILMVEGKNDHAVIACLLEHYHAAESFAIKPMEGIDRLLEALPVQIEGSELERLGVIVDADDDLDARWSSLRNVLVKAGYTVPVQPDPEGLVVSVWRQPTVGVWLMPDNTVPGMLEHFVSFLVPSNDPLWPRAGECVDRIPADERRFSSQHEIKARVHTWLAWQEDPGTPMGQAITKCYLDGEAPHAQRLLAWLRRLFEF